MPSLADALSILSEQSTAIYALSAHNTAPAGRYTTAYLDSLRANPDSGRDGSRGSRGTRNGHTRKPSASGAGAGAGGGSGGQGVLDLIRDAHESEERLFRFIGESEGTGGGVGAGRVKKVEVREGVGAAVVQQGQGEGRGKGREDVEVVLRTALRLVDDYRPMPRARATIQSLLSSSHAQAERILELELAIEELAAAASGPGAGAGASTTAPGPAADSISAVSASSRKSASRKVPGSADDAIKAEEALLRKLDAALAPKRRAALPMANSPAAATAGTGSPARTPGKRAPVQSSPPVTQSRRTPRVGTQTPSAERAGVSDTATAAGATTSTRPSHANINITNSLVSATPRAPRATATFDRFSPLKFLGTPRARAKAGGSALRGVQGAEEDEGEGEVVGRGIFGARPSRVRDAELGAETDEEVFGAPGAVGSAQTPAAAAIADGAVGAGAGAGADADANAEADADGDVTVRLGRLELASAGAPDSEAGAGGAAAQATTPARGVGQNETRTETDGVKRIEGIAVDQAEVAVYAAKIWSTLGETVLRQGLSADVRPTQDVLSLITHLVRLSRSDPETTSSSSSTSSYTAPGADSAPVIPVERQSIIIAHILLRILRACSAPTLASAAAATPTPTPRVAGDGDGAAKSTPTPATGIPKTALNEAVGNVIRTRGWETSEPAAQALAAKTVFVLVGKKLLRIDRRGTELVSFVG